MNIKEKLHAILVIIAGGIGTVLGMFLAFLLLIVIKAIELYDLIAFHRWFTWISR